MQNSEFPSSKPVADSQTAAVIDVATLLDQGDARFVRLAYQALLGRKVDDNGLANYLAQLRSGADKAGILVEIASSLEGRRSQIQVPGLDELITASRQHKPSRLNRFLQRLAKPLHTPTESLERGWRIVDNHLHRLEAHLVGQAAEISALRSDLQSMRSRIESSAQVTSVAHAAAQAAASVSGPAAGPADPMRRLVPPRAQQLLSSLRRTRALRLRVEQQ